MSLSDADIAKIAQTVDQVTGPRFTRLDERLQSLEAGQNSLVTSVDQMLAIVRRHEEEWLVLRAQHTKIRDLLLKKGIATEDELAVA